MADKGSANFLWQIRDGQNFQWQAERHSEFYEVCKTIYIGRGEKFLKIEQPPASFLQAMEEYVRDAPTMAKAVLAIEYKEPEEEERPASPPPASEPPPPASEPEPAQEPEPEPEPVKEEPLAAESTYSLGLNEPHPAVAAIDEKSALALAIVPIDDAPKAAPATFENGVNGWELALVTVTKFE
uniref:AP180 N-terminal homology (ANTH) domain-containing protein n=1 Tax=Arundo donax TaxID=35708 RepID=A0A0A9E722_ARUDO